MRKLFFFILFSLFVLSAQQGELNQAWDAIQARDYGLAEQHFTSVLDADPGNVRARMGLYFLYDYQRRYNDALNNLTALKNQDNYHYHLYSVDLSGSITQLQVIGEWQKLIDLFKDINDIENIDGIFYAWANERIGSFYTNANKPDDAEDYLAEINAIDAWQIIGPFDNISASGFDRQFAPEKEFKPNQKYSGKNGIETGWFKPFAIRRDHWLDFTEYYTEREAVFYANTFVYFPMDTEAELRVGTSGSLKTFVNDSPVHQVFDENNNDLDTYIHRVGFKAGWNRILVKTGFSEISNCNFLLRITDQNGQPLPGLKVSAGLQDYTPQTSIEHTGIDHPVEQYLKALLNQNPDHYELYLMLATAYMRNDKATEAELILKDGLAKFPNMLFKNQLYEAYTRGEKHDDLRVLVEQIYDEDNTNFLALTNQIVKAISNQNYDKAEKLVGDFRQLFGDGKDYLDIDIQLQSKKKNFEGMFALVDKAYDSYPNCLDYVASKSIITVLQTKDPKQGAKLFEKYLRRNASKSAFASYRQLLLQSGQVSEWEDVLDDAIEMWPSDANLYYEKGNVFFQVQKYDDAIKGINQALKVMPYNSGYLSRLADAHIAQNDEFRAVAALEKALKYGPTDYEAREKLREISGKPPVFDNFPAIDADALIAAAQQTTGATEDAVYLLKDIKRVVYPRGASESMEEHIIQVYNNEGIDRFSEYYIPFNSYSENIILEKAVVIKPTGEEVPADQDRNHLVFKSLEPNNLIHIKWRKRNYYRGKLSNHFWDEYYFQTYTPIRHIRYALMTPADFKYTYHTQNMATLQKQTMAAADNNSIAIWESKNIPAIEYEYRMPPLTDAAQALFISSIENWRYLVDWYIDLAQTKTRSTFEIKQLRDELFPEDPATLSLDEKMRRVYNYVTENIRYSSVDFRQSGLIPQSAEKVLKTKIGDCKDKATLAISLFNEIGVDAHYVLVNTWDEGKYRDIPPFIAFNHAIVGVKTSDGVHYMDLTAYNYPYNVLPYSDAGALALAIKGDSKDVFYLPTSNPQVSSLVRNKSVKLLADNSMQATIKNTRTGALAASNRNSYRDKPLEESRKTLHEAIASSYTSAELLTFKFSGLNSPDSSVVYEYEYKVPNYLGDAAGFKIMKLPWTDDLQANSGFAPDKRTYDLIYVNQANFVKEEITVELPPGYDLIEYDKKTEYASSAATYSMELSYRNGIIYGTRTIEYLKWDISPEEYPAFREFYNKVVNNDNKQYLLKKK
jgi:predicted Zn-dependent protease